MSIKQSRINAILHIVFFLLMVAWEAIAQNTTLQNLNQRSVQISLGVIAGFAIAIGIYLEILGWRLFKISCFVIGLVLGFLIGFYAVIVGISSSVDWAPWVAIAVGIAAGLFLGIIMFCSPIIGIILMGATIGVLIGSLVYTIALARTGFIYAFWIAIIVGGLIGALIALCIKKPLVILVTSFVGAYEICYGVGYFTGYFPGGYASLSDGGSNNPSSQGTPYQWFIYIGAIIVGTILGCIIQSIIGRDYEWEDMQRGVFPTRKDKFADSMSVPLVEQEPPPKKPKKETVKKNDDKEDYSSW